MTYHVRCTVCPFERSVADLEGAFALETAHADEWGADHLVDIELVE